jgi:putative FmdB family regulatory protein
MPKYSFECKCGMQFTRTLKMGDHQSHSCPSCSEPAPRVFEGFGFNFAQGGSAPANSGVAKHDYPTADLAVGKSADDRWAEIRARDSVKDKVRQVGGTPKLVRKNGPGNEYVEYTPAQPKLIEHRKDVVHSVRKAVESGKVT